MGSQSASDPVHTGNFYFDHEACAWNPRKDSAPTCYRFQWKYVALAVTFVVGLLCTGMPVSPRRRLMVVTLEGKFGKKGFEQTFTATVDAAAVKVMTDAIAEIGRLKEAGKEVSDELRHKSQNKPEVTMTAEPTGA